MQHLRDREDGAEAPEDVEAAGRPVQVADEDEVGPPPQDGGLGRREAVGPLGGGGRGFVGEPQVIDAVARQGERLRQPALPDSGAALVARPRQRDDREAGGRGLDAGRALQQDRPADPRAAAPRGEARPQLRGRSARGETAGLRDCGPREQHLAAREGQARVGAGQGRHVEARHRPVVEHAQARDRGGSGQRRLEAEGREGARRQHVASPQEHEVVGPRVGEGRIDGRAGGRACRNHVVAEFGVALRQDRRDGVA